jgi:hypothetical protein
MKIEGVPRHTVELHQTTLGIAPEAFNTVDMRIASGKLILTVIDSKMFIKADID